MNTTTTKPAIIQLDDASRSPLKTLSEYCKNCSKAVTNALNEFPVVQKTANCKISHGFVKENALISMLWTTTFENPPNNLLDIFEELFGGKTRKPESDFNQRHMDIAASIQEVTEEVVLKLAKSVKKGGTCHLL